MWGFIPGPRDHDLSGRQPLNLRILELLITVQRGCRHTSQNSAQYFLSTFSGPHAVHSPLLMDSKTPGTNPLNSPVINPFHR